MNDPATDKNLRLVAESSKIRAFKSIKKNDDKPAILNVNKDEQVYYVGVWPINKSTIMKLLAKKSEGRIKAVIVLQSPDSDDKYKIKEAEWDIPMFNKIVSMTKGTLGLPINEIDCSECKTPDEALTRLSEGNIITDKDRIKKIGRNKNGSKSKCNKGI